MLNGIYNIIDTLLPFQWLGHNFMKNAFLAVLLVTPIFGILGTMVVNNRMAFFSDSIGHGTFTGIAIGALVGIMDPIWGATLFSIVFAIIITLVKNKSHASTDSIIGVFSSSAIALGLVIMSMGGNFNKFSSYLVGDLLSVTPNEIILLVFVLIGVIILWSVIFNKVLLSSINPSLAASRGVKVLFYDILFTSTIAAVVTISIQWVGILIINSMLVLPASAARNISSNVRQYHLYSILIALFSGIAGLIISYYMNTATGAMIVVISSILFFITLIIKRLKSK